jgi:O-antigen/teichoic acid export membrane protein
MNNALRAIKNKYKEMSLPVKAGFWFTICNFMQRGITMITTPIFTRVLSEEQYGLVSTFTSWQNVLILITTLSLYKAMMNLYIRYDNKEQVLSAVSGLSLILSSAWFIIYFIFAKQISSLMQMSDALVTCLFVTFIAQAGIHCWQIYKRYTYEYRSLIVVTIALTAFSSLFGVLCVLFVSDTAEGRLIPQTIVTAIIGLAIYISIFKHDHTLYNKEMWSFALIFCVSLLPHYLSEFVLQSSDKLMINYMCGSRDVAMYSVAYSVGSLINLITGAINSSFAPYQYQQIKAKNYEHLSRVANQVLVFVAVMLGGLMLFSREVVLFFGGTKYIESADVIVPICIGVFFNYLFQLFARLQEYYERKLTVVIPSILCAVLNLILNYIFIKIFGYQAAAYTTFLCYLIFCVVHYLFYKKVCKECLSGIQIYDIKFIVVLSFAVIAGGFAIMFINKVLWLKYTVIGFFVIIMIIKYKSINNIVKDLLKNKS